MPGTVGNLTNGSPIGTVPSLRPPIRWAGGKYAIVEQLVRLAPESFNRYIEPMAGSAALFFALEPDSAILSDLNADLVNFYEVLKERPRDLVRRLSRMTASEKSYYRVRALRPTDSIQRARNFAYLNRLCWNGVYRVNRDGRFNVPIGDRLPQKPWNASHIYACSSALSRATLVSKDVFELLPMAKRGDFVFLDPPYPKLSKNGLGHNRYTAERFSLDSHRRLASMARRLSSRGVKIMIAISDEKELTDLYPASFRTMRFTTHSLISCTGTTRGLCREAILRNY